MTVTPRDAATMLDQNGHREGEDEAIEEEEEQGVVDIGKGSPVRGRRTRRTRRTRTRRKITRRKKTISFAGMYHF